MTRGKARGYQLLTIAVLASSLVAPCHAHPKKVTNPAALRTEYISRVQEQQMPKVGTHRR